MAVSWEGHTGLASLCFDGNKITPFWKATGGWIYQHLIVKGQNMVQGADREAWCVAGRTMHGIMWP